MTADKKTLSEYNGLPCHHWAEELPFIREILQNLRPLVVVETGTMYGGFAAFLADTVLAWKGVVVTFDHLLYPGLQDALLGRKNLHFVCSDVLDNFASTLILELFKDCQEIHAPSMFYADGPVGRPEFFRYAHNADIVGIHDYGTEVSTEQMLKWEQYHKRQPYMHDRFGALQNQMGGYFVSRFWIR